MRWCKLDIKKAADVASEVTQASNELKNAQKQNDSAAIEELRASIEKRIQELKQFYKDKNDQDDRAQSFEKQRLRLKGILAAINKAAEINGAGKAVQSAAGDAIAPPEAPSGAGLLESPLRPSDKSAPTPRPKSPKAGAGAQEARSPSPKGRHQPQPGKGEQKKAKHFKPLYKWEMPEGQEARTLKRYDSLSTEYGNFVPGSARGYYERDPADGEPQGTVDAAVLDFQLILTAEEYRTLQARRRGSSKYARQDEPKLSESIASSTPFLDRWRINAAMYRHATKEKWIVPEGFRIAPKP